jgi:hypothetical protein
MLAHIPSLATLESNDDGQLAAELELAQLRAQVAIVRTLADHIEYFARPGDTGSLSEQLIEEMARLAHRLFEATTSMTRSAHAEESGIFPRSSSSGSIGSSLDPVAH